ncbi:hypothetical protein K469DRAFT_715714 [Zopfia rhizophila CBS 207.26]|uniref:Uncharacterized protein n=1 Tax=Zopfia rhizophila CBS 207.26 TaxID=1314779 RepID=A0A6A6DR43_9PEZI|nr:hypothetical protein K469DRAFT_715714 [Zopfia rhizophila CBS 207.26]
MSHVVISNAAPPLAQLTFKRLLSLDQLNIVSAAGASTRKHTVRNSKPFTSALTVQTRAKHRVCDLSGRLPFELTVRVSRMMIAGYEKDCEKHEQPVTIAMKGFIIDLYASISNGTPKFVEMKSWNTPKENFSPVQLSISGSPKVQDVIEIDASGEKAP